MSPAEHLHRVAGIIAERQQRHGEPSRCLGLVAAFWSGYLDRPVSARDVCALMALLKLARIATGDADDEDHWLDTIGYAALGVAEPAKSTAARADAPPGAAGA